MDKNRSSDERSVWRDLIDAKLIHIGLAALLLSAAYVVLIFCATESGGNATSRFADFGQFGDSFGALTSLFNALAFAALIATVVLQSKELRDNRKELEKQSAAQNEWAKATRDQIALTKQLEAIRIRPFLKAEWLVVDTNLVHFRLRNVGLGVAIVRSIELQAITEHGIKSFDHITSHDQAGAKETWKKCLTTAVDAAIAEFSLFQFDNLNRALAPLEPQPLISIRIDSAESSGEFHLLRQKFHCVVHFDSVNGESFDTETQFPPLNAAT